MSVPAPTLLMESAIKPPSQDSRWQAPTFLGNKENDSSLHRNRKFSWTFILTSVSSHAHPRY